MHISQRKKKKYSIQWMTGTALMTAVILVLANTPLGMIRLPFLTATTLHIPVIIATLTLGWQAGMVTGLVFGIHSLINSLTAASFFAPFFLNPLVSVLPRVLFPLIVFAISEGVKRAASAFDSRHVIAYAASSALGTALHTVMVMGMIYLLNGQKIAQSLTSGVMTGVPELLTEHGVGLGIAALGAVNGVPEMIVAAVIAPVVALALDKAMGRIMVKK